MAELHPMTQQQLPLDLRETRQARADRIALLLQETDRVQRADVYFDEANAKRATAIAAADEGAARTLSRRAAHTETQRAEK